MFENMEMVYTYILSIWIFVGRVPEKSLKIRPLQNYSSTAFNNDRDLFLIYQIKKEQERSAVCCRADLNFK